MNTILNSFVIFLAPSATTNFHIPKALLTRCGWLCRKPVNVNFGLHLQQPSVCSCFPQLARPIIESHPYAKPELHGRKRCPYIQTIVKCHPASDVRTSIDDPPNNLRGSGINIIHSSIKLSLRPGKRPPSPSSSSHLTLAGSSSSSHSSASIS